MVDDEYVVLLLVGQSSWHVLGRFGNFCGADSLMLVTLMPLLSIIIALADGLESQGFSREPCHTM